MEIKGKVHCFFEQSGTFKNEFIKLGYEAYDYDIQNNFGQTDYVIDFHKYIHDMDIVQQYASMNRFLILNLIRRNMDIFSYDYIETIHNYIDVENMILRKGAVSAKKGEKLIIPMNMRDGSLICVGKGNEDWNCSAPHGAGRLMSRAKAKEQISIQEFKESMSDVFTTSVCEETLDEAPQAYKSADEIMSLIGDTVEIIDVIKPIYNFKAN
jgi:RNA-splicing ligase RtcB|nr:MAG TPA: tRNA-splicing ligase RtcB [Caudoviricetes sp.]